MDHATRQRRMNAAQRRYDAMSPPDDEPEGPACDECGAEMVGTFDHDDSGPSVEWHCPEEHACIVCGERAHGAECDACGESACNEHLRGGECNECDICHAAREAEAFATLGGIEHRVWQAAQAERRSA